MKGKPGSFAVGNQQYIEEVKGNMGYKAIGRKVVDNDDSFILRETQHVYTSNADISENKLCYDNSLNWQEVVAT